MNPLWLAQVGAVIRLEMKKTFFARRGLWVYLLAMAPAAIYLAHSLIELRRSHQFQAVVAEHPVSTEAIRSIAVGMTIEQVEQRLGEPYDQNQFTIPGRRRRGSFGPGGRGGRGGRGGQGAEDGPADIDPDRPAFLNESPDADRSDGQRSDDPDEDEEPPPSEVRVYRYTDGHRGYTFVFTDGRVENMNSGDNDNVANDTLLFATVFQFFYLRLAVFFGCVGVFMNLFRGEMLDKSLHFYLLAPLRREVLAVAKYLAGLIATVTIFTASTGLQLWALYLHLRGPDLDAYLANGGWGHIATYLGVTALACLGYGSVFLAAGMLFRNPIIPAAGVLVWEGANLFLPAVLKKISVIFYLQSLCPIVAPPSDDMPPPLRLLISAAEPTPAPLAILGLLTVTAAVLVIAGRQARRLEINYGVD